MNIRAVADYDFPNLAPKEGAGAGADVALDLFETEPPAPPAQIHPLRRAPDVLTSARAASYSTASINRIQRLAAHQAAAAAQRAAAPSSAKDMTCAR